jgi:hypothetical protein
VLSSGVLSSGVLSSGVLSSGVLSSGVLSSECCHLGCCHLGFCTFGCGHLVLSSEVTRSHFIYLLKTSFTRNSRQNNQPTACNTDCHIRGNLKASLAVHGKKSSEW